MQPILLDIIKEGRFYRQLKYTKRGFPTMVDGKILEVPMSDDIKKFVEESLPSLVGKDYNIEFAKQRV
jgi:hypothetical protein